MSLRAAMRAPLGASRSFSTTLGRYQEPSAAGPSRPSLHPNSSAGPSSSGAFMADNFPPTPKESGFSALSRLFEGRNRPPLASSAQPILPHTQPIGQAEEGPLQAYGAYKPTAVPPQNDLILELFTNLVMRHGQKVKAQKLIAEMLAILHEATNQNPIELTHRAVLLASPSFRIINITRGAKRIPSPRALFERQRIHASITWIKKASEKTKARYTYPKRLAREILLILEGESEIFQWLELRHKEAMMARSNMNVRG